jgi:hypothetical protein
MENFLFFFLVIKGYGILFLFPKQRKDKQKVLRTEKPKHVIKYEEKKIKYLTIFQ